MLHNDISTAVIRRGARGPAHSLYENDAEKGGQCCFFAFEAINCTHRAPSNMLDHFLMANKTSNIKNTQYNLSKTVSAVIHSAAHSFSFQLTQCNFPRGPTATHQSSGNVQHTLTTHSAAHHLSKSSSSPRARKTSAVYPEVLHRLSFLNSLPYFRPANMKSLTANSLPVQWSLIMISKAWARGPIRAWWWALACLCLASSQSMCEQLRSGRNRWWLLIKLSIPLRVIPPLQTHPHHWKKRVKKIHSYLTKTRLPHNISSD